MNIYAIVTSPTFRLRFWNRLAMRYSYYIYKRVYTIKFYFIARNISFKTIQAANKFTFYRYCAYLFIDTSNILTNALLHRVSFNNVIIPCCRSTLFYLPTFAMTNFSVNTLFNTMNFPCINIDVWSGKFKYNDVDTRQIYAGFGYRIKKKGKKETDASDWAFAMIHCADNHVWLSHRPSSRSRIHDAAHRPSAYIYTSVVSLHRWYRERERGRAYFNSFSFLRENTRNKSSSRLLRM